MIYRVVSRDYYSWTVESPDGDRQFVLPREVALGLVSWRYRLRENSLHLLAMPFIAWSRYRRDLRATIRANA